MCSSQLAIRTRRTVTIALGLGAGIVGVSRLAPAQQPVANPPPLPPYRPPALALVQPLAGASVPQDRPVLVFRFSAGDPDDPVDARSFALTVDGADRSALFQVAAAEAWGPLTATSPTQRPAVSTGAHQVVARICSIRGACSEVSGVVMVAASSTSAGLSSMSDQKRSLLDLLLTAARKLLNP